MTDVVLGSTSFKDTKVTSKSELSLNNRECAAVQKPGPDQSAALPQEQPSL